jgi:hypothetical protein
VLAARPISDPAGSVTSTTVRPSGCSRNPTSQTPTDNRTRSSGPAASIAGPALVIGVSGVMISTLVLAAASLAKPWS